MLRRTHFRNLYADNSLDQNVLSVSMPSLLEKVGTGHTWLKEKHESSPESKSKYHFQDETDRRNLKPNSQKTWKLFAKGKNKTTTHV